MKKTGRKTKHTPDKLSLIYRAVESGMSYKDACSVSGISEATFYEWKTSKPEFLEALSEAEAKGQSALLGKIRESPDWRSAAWILERRFSDTWGRKDKLETEQSVRFTGPPSLDDMMLLYHKAVEHEQTER